MNKENYSKKHWMVLAGAFLIMFCGLGLFANGLSLFNKVVAEDLGFSQTQFTLYFMVGTIVGLPLAPFVGVVWGKNYKRIKLIILLSGVGSALAIALNGFCSHLWQFYFLAVMRAFIGAFCGILPGSMLINHWFPNRRAFMTSIIMIGSSVGGLFFTQFCKIMINTYGWRSAYIVVGIIDALLFAVAVLLIRPYPDGYEEKADNASASKPTVVNQTGIMMKDAMKLPAFWIMIVGFSVGCIASMGFQMCIATALQLDYDYSLSTAANCYTVFVAVAIFGKLLMGWLYDHIGIIKSLIYQGIILVLAMVSMLLAGKSIVFGVLLAVFFGLGNMVGTVTSTVIPQHLFGLKDYSTIYGFLTMFITGSMGLGTTVSSAFYDTTGSYAPAWVLYIGLNILYVGGLIVAVLIMRKKNPKEQAE